MERFIRDRIASHLTSQVALTAQQHEFVAKKSCFTNLICFLDFHKAFNSVNHRMLLLKMKNYNLDPTVLGWIAEFLADRTFVVSVGGEQSTVGRVTSGVPQGSVLGPLLFLIYINDLSHQLCCPYFMFADDVKIVGNPSNAMLQTDLDTICRWTTDWDLPLNVDKCNLLVALHSVGPPGFSSTTTPRQWWRR